ncbi:hypothetical protein GCM10010363_73560 [Streptomyces omiyaensis]|nr:hypothetical protein GCM10010363_73560 [Streptomyces omiyaensis]
MLLDVHEVAMEGCGSRTRYVERSLYAGAAAEAVVTPARVAAAVATATTADLTARMNDPP